MDQGPLVNEMIEAGAKFVAEFHKYAPIKIVFWVKDSEEGSWRLCVASAEITDDNEYEGYSEVGRTSDVLEDPYFDPFKVKLLGANHRMAKAALEVRQRFPGSKPARVFDRIFGGRVAAEVYIYPSPLAVPAWDELCPL